MSYIMSYLDRFNPINVWNFLVIDGSFFILSSENLHGTEYPGLVSTHYYIIWWSEEFSLLNSRYVYTEVVFYNGELGDGVFFIISVIVCSFFLVYSQFLKHLFVYRPVPFHLPCFWMFWFHPRVYKSFCCRIVRFKGCWWLLVVQFD